jgi:hypothetical protein
MNRTIFLPFIASFSLFSCTNDSTRDLIAVDLNQTITYNEHIKPIIDANCINCHNQPPVNGAPMALLTYQNVKLATQEMDLISRVSLPEGNSLLMPVGGPRLPQPVIDVIEKWLEDGLQE